MNKIKDINKKVLTKKKQKVHISLIFILSTLSCSSTFAFTMMRLKIITYNTLHNFGASYELKPTRTIFSQCAQKKFFMKDLWGR